MKLPVPRSLAPLIVLSALALGAAGCGRDNAPDLVNGKTKFKQKCASCHVLARADAGGVQGPNLDQSFGPSRNVGFGEETVQGVVREQVALVRRNSSMPAGPVKGADARDVAAYVGQVAGQPGEDTGDLATAGTPNVANKLTKAKGGKLQIDVNPDGATVFDYGKAEAPAGSIKFAMANPSDIDHNIAIQGGTTGKIVGNGGTSEFTEKLGAGSYTYLCTVPGHAEGGMVGKLTVK